MCASVLACLPRARRADILQHERSGCLLRPLKKVSLLRPQGLEEPRPRGSRLRKSANTVDASPSQAGLDCAPPAAACLLEGLAPRAALAAMGDLPQLSRRPRRLPGRRAGPCRGTAFANGTVRARPRLGRQRHSDCSGRVGPRSRTFVSNKRAFAPLTATGEIRARRSEHGRDGAPTCTGFTVSPQHDAPSRPARPRVRSALGAAATPTGRSLPMPPAPRMPSQPVPSLVRLRGPRRDGDIRSAPGATAGVAGRRHPLVQRSKQSSQPTARTGGHPFCTRAGSASKSSSGRTTARPRSSSPSRWCASWGACPPSDVAKTASRWTCWHQGPSGGKPDMSHRTESVGHAASSAAVGTGSRPPVGCQHGSDDTGNDATRWRQGHDYRVGRAIRASQSWGHLSHLPQQVDGQLRGRYADNRAHSTAHAPTHYDAARGPGRPS